MIDSASISNLAAYRFVALEQVETLADAVRAYGERVGLRGTVLLAPEGINLFLSGQRRQLDEFLDWLGDHEPLLHGMSGKWSLSDSPAFARFKVKCKREIISFRDASCSPLTRSAEAIAPKTLRDWIRRGCDDEGKPLLLLDTRNREEVDWGTFRGAKVLDIDCFTDLPDAVAQRSAGWSGRRIVSFCTGGIRCEKAALWLADHGFDDVLQLQDGILGYFEQVGGEGFDGACFVFDERVALQADLTPVSPGAGMTDEPSTC
ncbi:MAG: sulfurtransferase [Xanthomonadales bacterium]|nr:sulfurtransferase [Xanthomonadales bacterium]